MTPDVANEGLGDTKSKQGYGEEHITGLMGFSHIKQGHQLQDQKHQHLPKTTDGMDDTMGTQHTTATSQLTPVCTSKDQKSKQLWN